MRTILEPQRAIPIRYETDVLVVGGGSAGFAAALASARTGARTMLVERYGFLGGMMTGGLVLGFPRIRNGINCELAVRLLYGGSVTNEDSITIDPEITKLVLDEMLAEEQVKILFHSYAANVVQMGRMIDAVIIEGKSGRQAIEAKMVVDATGDGDIAYFSGCPFVMGDSNGVTLPTTASFMLQQIGDFSKTTLRMGEKHQAVGQQDDQEMRINALDSEELSEAEIILRRKAFEWLAEKKKSSPEYRHAFISQFGSQLGVRETRRIVGLYELKQKDYEEKKEFEDSIGLTFRGDQIPYRSLIPEGIDNLLVAGRCVSYNRDLLGIMRMISTCITTGQASGTAAALASKENVSPERLGIASLQKELERQKVKL